MPRPHGMPRMRDSVYPHASLHVAPLLRLVLALIALILALPSAPAYAAPQLSLPTPPGETWKILQGYGCGSHGSWDRYSLDLVNADGRTRGAPVRAAADGTIWSWTGKSGTLILDHGGGNYTMYTHMASAVTTRKDHFVERGTVIGYLHAINRIDQTPAPILSPQPGLLLCVHGQGLGQRDDTLVVAAVDYTP